MTESRGVNPTRRRVRLLIAIVAGAILAAVTGLAGALVVVRGVRKGFGTPVSERLWQARAPLATGAEDADTPTVSVFLPERWHSTGTAMVICPGGAYRLLMSSYEGADIARWLNSFGVAGFVLKYRISPRYHHPAPLLDAARAIRFVRSNAGRFGLNPNRIGIVGFSAGGHLAATIVTHFDRGDPQAKDPVERVSSRPDFAILGYPIITMEPPWTHMESVHNLLGPNPDPALIAELSDERHVTRDTPPTFLFHTSEDSAVPAENSALFYLALRRAGVPAELHIFGTGRHGAGLANGHTLTPRIPAVMPWSALAERWLTDHWVRRHTWSYSIFFRI